MPNYGYHLARAEGQLTERLYNLFLPLTARRRLECARELPIDVFSYSGQGRMSEQIASIRSFLKNAGRPNRFVVVSDGSHSTEAADLLRRVDHCVSVEQIPEPPSHIPAVLGSYLRNHLTGKQLALALSLPRERPVLYVDSDVLFFDSAAQLMHDVDAATAPAYYLPDCGFSGDERLLHSVTEQRDPVNAGVLLILRPLDWSVGIERLLELQGEPNFFTSQTVTHLVMHANGARPLNPTKYVLQLDDQFIYSDRYAEPKLILRHYVNPVRHKFWTSFAR